MTPTPDPPADGSAPRPRRRWWRRALSLRGWMILVLFVGGGLGWWVRHVRLRRTAIATIEAAGGVISFADQNPPVEGWWGWLYQRTGIEEFREARAVTIQFDPTRPRSNVGAEATAPSAEATVEATVEALGHLGPIGDVAFYRFPITAATLDRLADVRMTNLIFYRVAAFPDDALDALSRLRRIEGLDVAMEGADLPRGIFRAAGELTRLKLLHLGQTPAGPLTRADLAPLGRLRRLERLQLVGVTIEADQLGALDPLDRLVAVYLLRARPDDAALRRLVEHHPRLEELLVEGSDLTDDGVAALSGLSGLNSAWLLGGPGRPGRLTDASLEALGRISTLQALGVTCGRFTAAGLDALGGLPLDRLELSSISPGGEEAIGRFVTGRTLRSLSLAGPGVTDAALPHLAGASFDPGSYLNLSRSAVTDAGMPHLAPLPVYNLALDGTPLTDAGLATLAGGMAARELSARGTRVTPAGIAAFEAARPGQGRFEGPPDDE